LTNKLIIYETIIVFKKLTRIVPLKLEIQRNNVI